MMGGYSSREYAASLSEFGTPYELRNCGGWILVREIPNYPYKDAMGCYPLFSCKDWSKISSDIKDLDNEIVSLALVTDPFGDFDPKRLSKIFDLCFLFKDHYIADLSQPIDEFIRKRSRKYAVGALREMTVEHCKQPESCLKDWVKLYNCLKSRYTITGIKAFSEKSFEQLLKTPGVEIFVARRDQEIIGMDIWLVNGDIGYAHLSAISSEGYKLRASYALYYFAMQHFSRYLRWLDHGGASGIHRTLDGLAMFKRGWASGTKPVYFCGHILNQKIFDEICRDKNATGSDYFPAYREGEFE